ncbi:MAG: STAS/SEC14 domain-containing protein [Candidatus Nanopelagicales bacterium]
MILIRSDMPPGTIGFEAVGELTADDYRDVIVPALERRLPDQPLRMLVLLDERFDKVTPGAAIQDIKLWLEHRDDWRKIAVVTDHEWITRAVDDVTAFSADRLRAFPTAQLDAAGTWLSED